MRGPCRANPTTGLAFRASPWRAGRARTLRRSGPLHPLCVPAQRDGEGALDDQAQNLFPETGLAVRFPPQATMPPLLSALPELSTTGRRSFGAVIITYLAVGHF